MKISFAITTHNEGNYILGLMLHLHDCLRPVTYDWEIIIADDYSDDELTLTILNDMLYNEFFENKIQIFKNKLDNNFGKHKNFLNSKCSGDYIFNIDADELPPSTLIVYLNEIIDENDFDVLGIPRINLVSGITENHIKTWGWGISINDNITSKKIINPISDEYKLLKNGNFIIEEKFVDGGLLVKFYVPIIMWPDYQLRIYKNLPNIKWDGKVHEKIVGCEKIGYLPAVIEYAIFHDKDIKRQEKQNEMYSKLID